MQTADYTALEMLDKAGVGRDPDALRGAVERLAEEVERLKAYVRHEKEQARIADQNFNHACDLWGACEQAYRAVLERIVAESGGVSSPAVIIAQEALREGR